MKNFLALSLFSASLMACPGPQEKLDNAQKDLNTAQKDLDDAKGDVVVAKQELAEYTYAQKSEYTNKMRKELDDISAELTQLSVRIEKSSGEAKTDAKVKLTEVQGQWAQAKAQLELAEASSEATWEEIKISVGKSYEDLKASMIKTRQWIGEKIEP